MANGKYLYKGPAPVKRRRSNKKMPLTLVVALLLLVSTIGGTLAWITTKATPVVNNFTPSQVSCEVTEEFDGAVKSNVNVTNTSNIDAYLRVKLISYRVNADGKRIGGSALVPSFSLGADWFEKDGYYYYSKPVAPGDSPATALISSITLADYNDVDGGKQVVEVMAEAIQAEGTGANGAPVTEAWKVTRNSDMTISA